MTFKGEKLIFLLSGPRAGSTMLQRMLAVHPAIHTSQEPWILLHPLYALRETGHDAEYSALGAYLFTKDFLDSLPEGKAAYYEGIRRLAGYLYQQALFAAPEARYFLDKTPRYYFVIPELIRLFPAAKIIFLFRHPLAVLASILDSWIQEEWFSLHMARHDLFDAPRLLLAGREALGQRAVIVNYESLVANPAAELTTLCRFLGLEFRPEMVAYGDGDLPRWLRADQRRVYSYNRPVMGSVDRWRAVLSDPQVWRLCRDYLAYLGPETVDHLGYSYDDAARAVAAKRPGAWGRAATLSLEWLLAKPPAERGRWEWATMRLRRSLRLRGIAGSLRRLLTGS